jgi:hypothetical protein
MRLDNFQRVYSPNQSVFLHSRIFLNQFLPYLFPLEIGDF